MKKIATIVIGSSIVLAPFLYAQHQPVPGETKSTKKTLLDFGSSMLQSFKPFHSFSKYFTTIHSFAENQDHQRITHEFCSDLSEDFSQSILFDSNNSNAKIIGVEYTISQRLFDILPDEEKILWHSNTYQVKGGLITAPRVPQVAEDEIMKMLLHTYSKTIYTWDYKDDVLPIGIPNFMSSPMNDYDVDKRLVRERDRDLGVNTNQIIESRKQFLDIERTVSTKK